MLFICISISFIKLKLPGLLIITMLYLYRAKEKMISYEIQNVTYILIPLKSSMTYFL